MKFAAVLIATALAFAACIAAPPPEAPDAVDAAPPQADAVGVADTAEAPDSAEPSDTPALPDADADADAEADADAATAADAAPDTAPEPAPDADAATADTATAPDADVTETPDTASIPSDIVNMIDVEAGQDVDPGVDVADTAVPLDAVNEIDTEVPPDTAVAADTFEVPDIVNSVDTDMAPDTVDLAGTADAAAPANLPPTAPVVAVVPSVATSADDLQAVLLTPSVDPDGGPEPLTYSYTWICDGFVQPVVGDRVPASWTWRGQRWWVRVVAQDGVLPSPESLSNEVAIGDAPPTLAAATLDVTTLSPLELATCSPVGLTDPDGDPTQLRARWLRLATPDDAGDLLADGPDLTFAPSDLAPGDLLACELTPHSGALTGPSVRSAPALIVAATPPSITLTPLAPPASGVRCDVVAPGAHLGPSPMTTLWWRINDDPEAVGPAELADLAPCDRVSCRAEVTGGAASVTSEAAQLQLPGGAACRAEGPCVSDACDPAGGCALLPPGASCSPSDTCAVEAACDAAGACTLVPLAGATGLERSVQVDIASRRLDEDVQDAVWDVIVRRASDPTGPAVFATRVAASQCGPDGSATVVDGACGEGAGDRVVTARLKGLYGAPVLELGAVDAPAPAGGLPFVSPGDLVRVVPCVEAPQINPVRFDVALARPTTDGYFTKALNFDQLYCSAAFTCCDDSDDDGDCDADRLLLFGADGQRHPTFTLGFTCAAATDPGMDLALYLDDLVLSCQSATSTWTVHPLGGDGNLCVAGALGSCAASKVEVTGAGATYGFQAAVYKGDSSSSGVDRLWWNLALGVDKAALAGATCTLTARATADNHAVAGGAQGGVIAQGVVYPVVTWTVAVSNGAAVTCVEHPLDDAVTNMVVTTYTAANATADTTLPWGFNP